MAGTEAFVVAICINAAIALAALIAFSHWRTKYPWCYTPRIDKDKRTAMGDHQAPAPPAPLPPKTKGFFTWVPHLTHISHEEVLKTAGLDAFMYVIFFGSFARVFGMATLILCPVLLPVYITGKDDDAADGLDNLGIGHTEKGSRRMWASWAAAYVLIFFILHELHSIYAKYMRARIGWLKREGLAGRHLTASVRNIPDHAKSEKGLRQAFTKAFPNTTGTSSSRKTKKRGGAAAPLQPENNTNGGTSDITDVTMPLDLFDLEKLVAKRDKIVAQLERAHVVLAINQKKGKPKEEQRPMAKTKCLCCGKRDAIEYYEEELKKVNEEIAQEMDKEHKPLNVGFVSFAYTSDADLAILGELDDVSFQYDCQLAVEPRDVHWPSLRFSRHEITIRFLIVLALTSALIIFWSIPVTFVASLNNLDALSQQWSALEPVADLPAGVKGFVEGYLPAIGFAILMAVLPLILRKLSTEQGSHLGHSLIQVSTTKKFFVFVVVHQFVVTTLAGSVMAELESIVDDFTFSRITTELGSSVPAASSLFVTYVMLSSFVGFPMSLLRIGPLLVGGIKKKWLVKTPRELRDAEKPPEIFYDEEYPRHLLIILLGVVFGVMSPIILPFAFIYFANGYLAMKWRALWVAVPRFEGGGKFWPAIFHNIISCLIVAELTFIGFFSIKEAPAQAALMFPILVLTVIFSRYTIASYVQKSELLPLLHASEVDTKKQWLLSGADDSPQASVGVASPPRYIQKVLQAERDVVVTVDDASGSSGQSTFAAPARGTAVVLNDMDEKDDKDIVISV